MANALNEMRSPRAEQRLPMTLVVHLSGHRQIPGVESTFTENVSMRGARVFSVCPWQIGDRLAIALVPGDFRSDARVAYCLPVKGEGFALGLEFLGPTGHWVLNPVRGSENNLHG